MKNQNSYFRDLDTKKITDNITFWKTVVPLFTNKPSVSKNIIINEGDKPFQKTLLCQIFNTFSSNFVSNLDIPNPSNYFKKEKFHTLSAIIAHFEKTPECR